MSKEQFDADQFDDQTMQDLQETSGGSQSDPWTEPTQAEMIEAQTAETYYEGAAPSRINRGTIIIMAACVLGIAGVFFFSLKNKPKEITEEDAQNEAKVEQMLTKLVDEKERAKARKMFEDTETMIQTFYDYPGKQQVAIDELQRDPFEPPFEPATPAEDDLAKQREKRRAELEKRLAGLRLQSVIQAPDGARCMVNGEIYAKGQIIQELFEVVDIQEEIVHLSVEDHAFELAMKSAGPTRRR